MGLLIFLYPFAEIYAWIKFISVYSFVDGIYLLMTGFLVGSIIMSLQGKAALMSLLNSAQGASMQGKSPGTLLFHRALIWVGGLLIFLPGIISKILGTAMVLPGTRHMIILYLKATILAKISSGAFKIFSNGFQAGPNPFSGNFGGQTGFDPFAGTRPHERDVYDVTPTKIEHKNHEDSNN